MLIIWDFDGVICDSDDIWAQNWCDLLKTEKGIVLSETDKRQLLIGVSEKDKASRLENHFKICIDENFKQKLNAKHDYGMKHLLTLTPGVEKIFQDVRFKQCIATGGNTYQNNTKNHTVGIDKYFDNSNCFTADMVIKGKPAPDIFLLAAEKMNVPAQQCVVIEDAVSGITAAKRAKMNVFAFIGAKANNNAEYRDACLNLQVDGVFDSMADMHLGLIEMLERNTFFKEKY